MTDNAATTTTVISERDQRCIRAAMSRMPYAATERVPKPWAAMGEAGVTRALEIIANELDITMAFCGRTNLRDVDRSILIESTIPR